MWRLWAVFTFISVCFLIIAFRLGFLQIVMGGQWKKEADLQHYAELVLPAQRGAIVDSEGSPLVINEQVYLAYLEPKKITDMKRVLDEALPALGVSASTVSAQLSDATRVWIPLAHKVSSDTVERLKLSNIAGLGFEKESKRFYPEASMAAHLLGFVGLNENGQDTGYFGIEGYYDRELRGRDGVLRHEKDVHGNPIMVAQATRIEAQDGRTLVLWLDRAVQNIVETKLKEGIGKYGAIAGSVTVMDPVSGGLLAMASFPSYDPAFYHQTAFDRYKNPVVSDAYEPGSTFKTVIMSAGLDSGAVTPQTMMDESGPVTIGQYSIKTWNEQYRGTISMTDVLVHSSNVGMVYVSRALGAKRMLSAIRAFGFGTETGIDVQEEISPQIRDDNDWKEIDLATGSFGQGIAVTPIQMVRAVSAIANGGWLMEPHIVKEIKDSQGKVISVKPKKVRQVLSQKTARQITDMMVLAVDDGEAKWAKPKGYRIAGKTGTAQIPVAGHYDDKKTIASFVGFAPADNPKFIILVTLREPSTSPWGSETAAPLFFAIAKDLFTYYGIAP